MSQLVNFGKYKNKLSYQELLNYLPCYSSTCTVPSFIKWLQTQNIDSVPLKNQEELSLPVICYHHGIKNPDHSKWVLETPVEWVDCIWRFITSHPEVSYAVRRDKPLYNDLPLLPITFLSDNHQIWIDAYYILPEVEIFLDTETTGLPNPYCKSIPDDMHQFQVTHFDTCRLLEIAWVVRDKRTKEIYQTYNVLVQPPASIDQAYDMNLLSEAKEIGQPVIQVFKDLYKMLQCYSRNVLVCHNVSFDRSVIAAELARAHSIGLYREWLEMPTCCTMLRASPHVYKNMKWPKLQVLHEFLGCEKKIQTHRALDDVNMLIECYDKMVENKWL